MLKLIRIFLLEFFLISNIQSEIYLECKFDVGTLPCELTPVNSAPKLDKQTLILLSDPSIDPLLPLSDVTSIVTPTIGNGAQCRLPYKLNNNSKEIYFCSKVIGSSESASCFTRDGTKQECVLGDYVSSQLESLEDQTYFIEVSGTTSSSCLSLYYYITRPNSGQIVIWSTDIVGGTIQQIGKASDVPYNGWHRTQFSFSPQVNNYHVHFSLQRLEDSDELLFIALDEIMVINGLCEDNFTETSTANNVDQTTQGFIKTTTTIASFTTEESMLSSVSNVTPLPSSSPISPDSNTTTPIPVQTTEQTTTSTTTRQPIRPIFQCNFTTPCFGNGQLTTTDGSEFNSPDLSDASEPPRAPTSDVTSITQPTSNNEKCQLPFRPSINNGPNTTTWDMWFCNNNQCPTSNGQMATCASGLYGLVSLDSSETSKIVVDSLTPNAVLRDSVGDQCLRFYYYFTVYDEKDWSQEIQLWIRPNNQAENQSLIDSLTVNEMKNNSWNFRETTFNSGFTDYTLAVMFIVGILNRTTDAALNKTIYFALDNIELYDYNCSYIRAQVTTPLPSSTTITSTQAPAQTTTTTVTTTEAEAIASTTPKSTLGFTLGLSLGLGVPLVIVIIGLLLYKCKPKKRRQGKDEYDYGKYFPLESPFKK